MSRKRKVVLRRFFMGLVGIIGLIGPAVQAQPDQLSYSYYAKFPDYGDTRLPPPLTPPSLPSGTYRGLQQFHEYLARMRQARNDLREDCVGPKYSKMVVRVRGADVLIWPERFSECEAHARLLAQGEPLMEQALGRWNQIFGTNYPPPRGESADIQAWERRKQAFERFPVPGCDGASRAIELSGSPGFSDPPALVFERMRGVCGRRWVSLFEPEGRTPKDTGLDMPIDEDLGAIASGAYKKIPQKSSESELSVKAQMHRRVQAGVNMEETLVENMKGVPRAGSVAGVQIFGGENGRRLEQVVGATSTLGPGLDSEGRYETGPASASKVGCDEAAEDAALTRRFKDAEAQSTHMPFEERQCFMARAMASVYRGVAAFSSRCFSAVDAAKNRAAAEQMERQQASICSGLQPKH